VQLPKRVKLAPPVPALAPAKPVAAAKQTARPADAELVLHSWKLSGKGLDALDALSAMPGNVGPERVVDEVFEPLANAPGGGPKLLQPKGLELAGAEQHANARGLAPLNARDLLGVEAKLEHVGGLRVASELGVDNLVPVVVLPLDKVGKPAPVAVDETAW
jgi:hypothetical protein